MNYQAAQRSASLGTTVPIETVQQRLEVALSALSEAERVAMEIGQKIIGPQRSASLGTTVPIETVQQRLEVALSVLSALSEAERVAMEIGQKIIGPRPTTTGPATDTAKVPTLTGTQQHVLAVSNRAARLVEVLTEISREIA